MWSRYGSYITAILSWLKNYYFPPFHKKVVISVLGIGSAILLDGYFLQGLVRWGLQVLLMKITGGASPDFSEVETNEVLGVILIGLALLYSLLTFALEQWSIKQVAMDNLSSSKKQLERDKALYDDWKKELGSNTFLADFIKNHHFGTTWDYKQSQRLDDFCNKWSTPEHRFLHGNLSSLIDEILAELKHLNQHLGETSGPLKANADLQCIFDPSMHDEWDMPDHIEQAIDKANSISHAIAEKREKFIEEAEIVFSKI